MYVLVFTMLIIGMLGIYTQVYAIEVARFFSNQTGIADTMIVWHEAGMSIAGNVMNPTTQPPTFATHGCRVTNTAPAPTWPGAPPICTVGATLTPSIAGNKKATVIGNGTYSYTDMTTGIVYTYPYLPNYSGIAYSGVPYEWKSIAYQTGGSSYLVTYVDPASISAGNPAPGNIATAPATQLGINAGDLLHELKQTGVSSMNFGYVMGGNLITSVVLPTGPIVYALPPLGGIPDRSVAIISNFTPCNSC